jgi:hypothetical protein
MKRVLVSLATLLTLAGAASAAPHNFKPDWVSGSSMEFPREQYVTGVGSADDRRTAEDRARGEISRVFSSQVTVTTSSEASEAVESAGGRNENSSSQSARSGIRTYSKKILQGVEITETWQDDSSRVWYALAVLDKAKYVPAVTDRIGELDSQAKQLYAQVQQSTEKFERVKSSMKLLSLFKTRKELESDLRVLSDKGVSNPLDEGAVRALAAKSLAELDVSLRITGVKSREVQTGIVKALSGLGMQARSGSPENNDLVIDGEVEVKPIKSGEKKWKFARSSSTVNLIDGRTGKVFLQFEAADKGASASYESAVHRSLDNLAKKVATQVSEGISQYFENQ